MNFISDNSSAAAPQIINAISSVNAEYQPSYGDEDLAQLVNLQMCELFEAPQAQTYLVATGTAANALCLACFCPPWGAVYCHHQAHVEEDECGAPEFYTGGAKLVKLKGGHGRIDTHELQTALVSATIAGVHNVQRGALSITNATELGAVYTPETVTKLSSLAATYKLRTHLDGARLANAIAHLGCTPAEITWKAGVSAVVFGGTKNGLLGVEAVVFFDDSLCWEFELRRKRGGHLFSKHRYLSAQIDAYLKDDLWLTLATQANNHAQYLAEKLLTLPDCEIAHPVEANMVFPILPRKLHAKALSRGAKYYLWPMNTSLDGDPEERIKARFVCSWSTTKAEIDLMINNCFCG